MQIQFKDHAGSRRRHWDTDDRTIASNTNTLDELDSQCFGSGSPTSGELAIRTEQTIQIFKKNPKNHSCSGSRKVFDYDVWISEQTRVRDEIIKIGVNDFSTIKKLAKSRLQTNYRYIKGPMRPVDYILKMKFFDKKLGKKAKKLKDLINLKKLISSPEFSFEAQVWRGMTTLCVGKTVIEMSLAKIGDVYHIPIVQIYNDIFMLHQSKRTDPLKQAIVYVQKSKYCQQDIDYFHETIIEPIQKELHDSEIILEVPDAKYSISLRSGCVGHINGYPVSDDLSCIHISSEELDEVYCRLLGTIEGFVSVAQIPKEEIERYFEENGTTLPDSCYHVFFSSHKHCLAARRKHRDMMPYLVCENIIGEAPAIEFAMDIKWYVRPFQGRAHLTIRNPHELTFTQEVLKHHNVVAEFFIEDDKSVYDQLDLRWGGALRDTAAHDEKVFAQIVRKALALNHIYYKSFTIEREQARFCTKKNLVRRIHQRLVRAAINSGCWNRTIPIEDEDWDKLFEDSQNLPWHVTIGHEFPFHDHLEGNASVVFTDNFEMAEKLMCFLLERSPDKDTFTLNPMDKLGARFFPCYRSFRYIPLNIRAACHDKITELDVKWREQGSSDHLNWLRLRDCGTDREECRLTVEGWPIDNVHSACEKLSQVCDGIVLDCSIGNREVLFTDFGDAFIYNLNEKYAGAVVFLVDRLNRSITLYGAEQLTTIVEEKLLCFTANWEYFIVETSVVIDRPRYFPQLKDVIEKLSKDIIEQNNGGGVFKNVYDSVYHFKGQIHQFRELVQLLETLQDAVEDVYFENRSVRPICPICFMKVDLFSNYQLSICGDYYCLSCLVRMIKHYIKSRELPIFCCVSTCKASVAVEDIIFLLMGDMKMPARFLHKKFQPIIQSILDVNLAVNPHLKPCSTPDCIGINILTTVPGSTSVCSKCGAIRCGQCCENVHDGFSCEYYKRISGDVQLSISEFKKSKGKSVRDCPNVLCQAVIEKSAGCNHMQCHYCKTNFCWLCEYNSDCQKNVYIHLNEVHGGAGGGWRVENDMIVGFPDDVAEDVLIAAALENALEL